MRIPLNAAMGCCFSCSDDDDSESGEDGIRQPLIDPVSITTQPLVPAPHNATQVRPSAAGIQFMKGQADELAKIVKDTASAMIDVSGSKSHSINEQELEKRSLHYLQKLQTLSPDLLRAPNHLLGDVQNPVNHLEAPLISQEDLDLMNWAMDEVEKGLHSIRVEHNEDLVVHFRGQQASLSRLSRRH